MATCKECLHFDVCAKSNPETHKYWGNYVVVDNVEVTCPHFTPKSDYVKREHGEWISVKDRLPKESCECLAVTDCGDIYMVEYSHKYKAFNATDDEGGDSFALRSVTHWQPLPEPPKGE